MISCAYALATVKECLGDISAGKDPRIGMEKLGDLFKHIRGCQGRECSKFTQDFDKIVQK